MCPTEEASIDRNLYMSLELNQLQAYILSLQQTPRVNTLTLDEMKRNHQKGKSSLGIRESLHIQSNMF